MQELEAQLARIIADYQRQAMASYQMAVQAEGLVFSGDLEDSFRAQIRMNAQRFVYECEIMFLDYGRYKDMKYVNTGDLMAPLEAMEYFVEKTGPEKFLNNVWAQRYKTKTPKAQSRLIRDIAWGVRIARFRKIEHVRKGRSWYAKKTGGLYAITNERIREAAALATLRFIKQALQQP